MRQLVRGILALFAKRSFCEQPRRGDALLDAGFELLIFLSFFHLQAATAEVIEECLFGPREVQANELQMMSIFVTLKHCAAHSIRIMQSPGTISEICLLISRRGWSLSLQNTHVVNWTNSCCSAESVAQTTSSSLLSRPTYLWQLKVGADLDPLDVETVRVRSFEALFFKVGRFEDIDIVQPLLLLKHRCGLSSDSERKQIHVWWLTSKWGPDGSLLAGYIFVHLSSCLSRNMEGGTFSLFQELGWHWDREAHNRDCEVRQSTFFFFFHFSDSRYAPLVLRSDESWQVSIVWASLPGLLGHRLL